MDVVENQSKKMKMSKLMRIDGEQETTISMDDQKKAPLLRSKLAGPTFPPPPPWL